jgi:GrpB-like predicted nucleotidyltransferase (UPF0157 family)
MSSYTKVNRPILVVDYDTAWPVAYEKERARLSAAVGARPAVFEHIGSTAVPGLCAKPVIDVAIGIPDLRAATGYLRLLERLGYEYVPEFEVALPRRRFLWRGTYQVHSHHIHLTEIDDPLWIEPLVFRDFLRSNPAVSMEYCALKQRLARQNGEDIGQYVAGKSEFVAAVLRRSERHWPI